MSKKSKRQEKKNILPSVPDRYWQIIVAVIAVILFSVNFTRIFDNAFWGDEAYSIKLARESLMKMLQDTANDVHPPLYYVLLMLLFRIFGDYGWVYHLSAIIPYGILLIISCTLFYKEFGKETALLFNVFISFLTYSVFFNIEVRMYSLSAVELVMAFFGYYLIFKDSERISGYVIFTVSSIAAAYTHYYCIVSVSVFYLALLIMFLKKKMLLKRLMAVYVLTIAAYLPWVVIGLSGSVKRTADNFWMTDIPSFQSTFLSIFSAGNLFYSLIIF